MPDAISNSSSQNYITDDRLLGTAYGLLATTTLFFFARVAVRIWRPKATVQAEDYIIVLAYLMYVALVILYIVVTPAMYRVAGALTTGKMYPEIYPDGEFLIKTFFTTTLLLWLVLWAVKLSFMMLYRRLFSGIKFYQRLWWAVIIFCAVTLVGSIITNFTSCSSMKAWFTPGLCTKPRDIKAQIISLYFSFAVDVITDLMIMFLPLGLIWNLQLAPSKKIGIAALFGVGWICIVAAIIRVIQIGVKSGNSSTPSSSWLAFWAIIESSIAVIIGCCPGLYVTAKEVRNTHKGTSDGNGYAGRYLHGSRGYEKHDTSEDERNVRMRHIQIQPHTGDSHRKTNSEIVGGGLWIDDGDSTEELRKQIMVTNTVEVRDAGSIDRAAEPHRTKNFSIV